MVIGVYGPDKAENLWSITSYNGSYGHNICSFEVVFFTPFYFTAIRNFMEDNFSTGRILSFAAATGFMLCSFDKVLSFTTIFLTVM